MDNACTKHSAQRFHNVIYSNVLIIIWCSLYDRLAVHMLHISVLSFSKWFQSYFKTIMANSTHGLLAEQLHSFYNSWANTAKIVVTFYLLFPNIHSLWNAVCLVTHWLGSSLASLCWVHTKSFLKSKKIFKIRETTNTRTKILDVSVLLLYCVVWCDRQHTTTHKQIFWLWTREISQNLSRFENKYVLQDTLSEHSCCCHKLTSWSSISTVQCFCAVPWLCLLCICLLSANFLIGYCFVSRDNLQIKCAFILGVPLHTSGFLIVNIQHVWVSPTFFRADSVTLNTSHTTGKSLDNL